ncbi:MAG: Fur family transcriptional regulator [Actinomycetota bacterium]
MAQTSSSSRVEQILDRIVANGGRRTMSRQAVIRVIVDCHGHITADAIAQQVQKDFPSVDVSTVYRTLETLRDLEVVDRVYFADGSTVYHLRDHQHHHLCCEKCGKVQELPMDHLAPLEATVLEKFGFELHQRPVGLFGLCAACRH